MLTELNRGEDELGKQNDRKITQEVSEWEESVLSFSFYSQKLLAVLPPKKAKRGLRPTMVVKRDINRISSYFLKGQYVCI